MSNFVALLAAVMPLLTAFGGGVAWWISRVDARVRECETKHAEERRLTDRLRFEVRRDGLVIRMLFVELQTRDPANETLHRVSAILHKAYDPSAVIDDAFDDLIERIA